MEGIPWHYKGTRGNSRAKNIVTTANSFTDEDTPVLPVLAAYSISTFETTPIKNGPSETPSLSITDTVPTTPITSASVFMPINSNPRPQLKLMFFTLVLFIVFYSRRAYCSELDATGKALKFYPDSLMLSSNPQALAFYEDTTLVSVHVDADLHRLLRERD